MADDPRAVSPPVDESLDPIDWSDFRELAHRMLDAALDHVEGVRDRPVWRPIPDDVRAALSAPLPVAGEGSEKVCQTITDSILPHATGNTHPSFFGWVHGAGVPIGIVAEMVASAMNANVGGRQHGAVFVERQVIEWCRELFGLPVGTSGLVVTGTSMANVIALAVARHWATGGRAGELGIADQSSRLVGYTSTEAHGSLSKAFSLLGLGSNQLRRIAVDRHFRIDTGRLADTIDADRAAGFSPFCVVGTAGTVNSGAIDDLGAIADLCKAGGLWFHVDGAFGALAVMSETLKPRLAGLERVDSLAFDFHKWMHVPYDAGCVLVRDGVEVALQREVGGLAHRLAEAQKSDGRQAHPPPLLSAHPHRRGERGGGVGVGECEGANANVRRRRS